MKKREAKFGLLFRHWHKANKKRMPKRFNFELKQTLKSSIPFSSLRSQQWDYLLAGKGEGFMYKIPDDSISAKPFDGFWSSETPGYVIIRFPKHFEIIDIETLVLERSTSKRKSLTSDRAKQISIISVRCG